MRMLLLRDWRQALRTPHVYRVGNGTFRLQHQFIGLLLLLAVVPLVLYTYPRIRTVLCLRTEPGEGASECDASAEISEFHSSQRYNFTYPVSPTIKSAAGISFRIGIISDLDKESKDNARSNTWFSLFKKGHLFWIPRNNFISISWEDQDTKLISTVGASGRGMELSELVTFDGRLITFDDRTGIVYRLENDRVYPWIILMDGNGIDTKGFKSEWAAVKNERLYVGSMGKEWTTESGEFQHNNPCWIKIISTSGEIRSINWLSNYKKLRKAIGIEFPGYMIHESGTWSDVHGRWFFLPRRCSLERYNETTDEIMSCNVLLSTDENFTNIKVTKLENPMAVRGFSSFKFLPGSRDSIIVALKSEEYKGRTATYITAFTIDGHILFADSKIADYKFEGFEFI